MKIIWYPPGPRAEVLGPFMVSDRLWSVSVLEIKCTYATETYSRAGYNIARIENVPLDKYKIVGENVRLMAEMGLYEQAV